MNLTDFLGKEYGPGDLVLYAAMSGRCPNIILGRVTDIYRVFYDSITYRWKRLAEDEAVPRKLNYKGEDIGECDNALRVKVQPIKGARWEQHHSKTYYIDTRSGKRINPDAPSRKHILKEAHYVFKDGVEYDYEAEKDAYESRTRAPGMYRPFDQVFRQRFHINYGDAPGFGVTWVPRYPLTEQDAAKLQLWYVSRSYQPWVEKHEEGPKPVTIEVTGNIVKWEGELPDAS